MRIDRADFWQTRFYILHQFCIFSIVRPRKPSRQSMQSLPKYIATTLRWSFSSECPMCHIVIWSVPDFLTYLFDNKNLWRCLLPHLVNWTSWWRTMKRWQSPIFFPPPFNFWCFQVELLGPAIDHLFSMCCMQYRYVLQTKMKVDNANGKEVRSSF